MENLNAEQVKKDLKELMFEAYASNGAHKPYLTMRDALALINSQEQRIKELTEEVADLEAIAEGYQKQFEDCGEDRAKLTEENERLRAENVDAQLGFRLLEDAFERLEKINEQIEADTVMKMHSMLCEGRVSNDNVVIVANQVAKEMLEGENEN